MNETAPALPWLLTPQHVLTLNVRAADIDDFNHVNNVV
jgi:acyl-ACP thioesterase